MQGDPNKESSPLIPTALDGDDTGQCLSAVSQISQAVAWNSVGVCEQVISVESLTVVGDLDLQMIVARFESDFDRARLGDSRSNPELVPTQS